MTPSQLAALAFIDETNKIASAIGVPVNQLTVKEAESLIEDFFDKSAANRAVKEWQASTAAGDTAGADRIAKGYSQLGLPPRQLQDVSIGGAEAGVDRMMGDVRHSTGQPLSGPAPNESGYVARKMYKPDSIISQAEFTPQHVQQKMDMTQAARSLSPEAKSMVPDMYGMKTQGSGSTQRTMSYHEYVPGMTDLRKNPTTGVNDVANARPAIQAMKEQVMKPLQQKGMMMGDVSGAHGTNWGNVARAGDGSAKIVDFLPSIAGESSHASKSFSKYAPMPTMRHSVEGGGSLGDLRKEMYKPTMQSQPASTQQLGQAMKAHGIAPPSPTPSPAQNAPTRPASPRPMASATSLPVTKPVNPGMLRPPVPAMGAGIHMPSLPTKNILGGLHR